MRKHILILLLSVCSLAVYSQVDTEFWFACPDLSSKHFQDCIRLSFITFDEAATVTISQPANPAFNPVTLTIGSNSHSSLELKQYLNQVETLAGGVRKTGILIKSDNLISAYYANYCDNSEIYSLKGKNALGTDFIVPTQYEYNNSVSYGGGSSVEIVASEDSTDVTITPTQNCIGHPKDVTFTIRLNRGESYALRASGMQAADHLFNTRIASDKPIALNYTDDSVDGPGTDLIGDQIVPVSMAGTNYIAVKNTESHGTTEKVYIFPTANNTTVNIDGTVLPVMNIGGKHMHVLSNTATYITSDEPVIVLQITSKPNGANSDELGAAILPTITCTGSSETAYNPVLGGDVFVSILTKTENTDGFIVNNSGINLLPSSFFNIVPHNPAWSYYIGKLSAPGSKQALRIKNTKGTFHMGVFDNPGNTCSFGYYSRFNSVRVEADAGKGYYTTGEQIQLNVKESSAFENYQWTGPNGFSSNLANPVINNATITDAGMYIVEAQHKEGCQTFPDTIYISLFEEKTTLLSVCSGNSIGLEAEGYAPYKWTPASLPADKVVSVNPSSDTKYSVISYKEGYNLLDADNSSIACANNGTLWNKTVRNVEQSNQYLLSASLKTSGTSAQVKVHINGRAVGNVISLTNNWLSDSFLWTCDASIATLSIEIVSGSDEICAKDIRFASLYPVTDTYDVLVRDSITPVVSGNTYLCRGVANLQVEGIFESYLWSNGATTQSVSLTEAGTYSVRVKQGDCQGTAYITITPGAETAVINEITDEICSGDFDFSISYQALKNVEAYSIVFSEKAVDAGFINVYDASVTANNSVTINLPENIRPDVYNAELRVFGEDCSESKKSLEIKVNYAADIITQRWNDVLGVKNEIHNGGYTFKSFQWYRNGQMLTGENGSNFYLANAQFNINDIYQVELTRDDDVTLFSCGFTPELLAGELDLIPILKTTQTFVLKNISSTGKAYFFNLNGTLECSQSINETDTEIQAPRLQGLYILHVVTEKDSRKYKVIVN